MSELAERQICLGCRKRINLLVDGFRCLDCPFFFCRPCAEYHFGRTPLDLIASNLATAAGLCEAFSLGEVNGIEHALRGYIVLNPEWHPGCGRCALPSGVESKERGR